MVDAETDVYNLLAKLKEEGNINLFYKFSREVVREYTHGTDELDMPFLIEVIETYGEKYSFFQKLSEYEQNLIGAMLWGCIGG